MALAVFLLGAVHTNGVADMRVRSSSNSSCGLNPKPGGLFLLDGKIFLMEANMAHFLDFDG